MRLQQVDGLSIDITFGAEITNEFYQDGESVDAALEQMPDDRDVECLAKANCLSNLIWDLDMGHGGSAL
jgi:hypothetical protein